MRVKPIIVLMIILFAAANVYCAEARDSGDNVTDTSLRRFAEKSSSKFDDGSFFAEGFVKVKYENVKNENETSSLLRSYADVNFVNIGVKGLSVHFSGTMQNNLKNADEIYDIYYGYVRYKSFQNAIDVMAGRFELVDNNFMTLDGGKATFVTPYYFGVTVYGGIPFYRNYEDKKLVFRNTGDLLYGGRVFLSGIESVKAYVGYSRETGKGDDGKYGVFAELASAGASYIYEFNKKMNASAFALGEYDLSKGLFSRASGKLSFRYDWVEVSLFGDLFDVRERYPKGRELVIQLISTGRERRAGGNIAFDITKWLSVHGGAYGTEVELKDGTKDNGGIYKAGFDVYLMQYIGLVFGGEYYAYTSKQFNTYGGILSADWRISHDLALYVAGELADFDNQGSKTTAYSVFTELKLYLLPEFYVSVFYEKGANNRFIDDMRCGATVKYGF